MPSELYQKKSPISVTVVDSAGSVIVQKRMDGSPPGAYLRFSLAKARSCVYLETSSRNFREKYTSDATQPAKFTQAAAMVTATDGEIIPVAGGVLVVGNVAGADGSVTMQVLGAVGVSGAAADEDEYLAIMGVRSMIELSTGEEGSIKVFTVPPEHSCTTLA
uniref:Uncharacterized protein n=1 Tax=Corethron hystrix TaxID=216773 RepID=A0A7S1BLJ1_9STRA|mmetsp:Transcript_33215/g.76652  ORF Transcript_33215/g.76652 Transcript_33215/m.76652 type:complete len:162 (+) Transcript_33215:73-558(+)